MTKYLNHSLGRFFGASTLGALLLLLGSPSILHADDAKQKPLMKDFIGINGHATFKPDLYQPIASLARCYHNIWWDTDGVPSVVPSFPVGLDKIIGNDPIDWSKLFGSWKDKGFTIDDSVQFEFILPDKWKDMEKEAYNYGLAYAKCFGPSNGNFVTSAEIGNEPSQQHWPASLYKKFFTNMAKGFRDGDPKLKIVTSWATSGITDKTPEPMSNLEDVPDLWDVINIHTYSNIDYYPTWRRVHPEHSDIGYLKVVNELIDWRNQHAAGKEIWITEFGYDAKKPGFGPGSGTFAKWISSTETEQAQWLVRSFLIFSGMDVDRAYLYYYNDTNDLMVHGSSGITRNFVPKPAYYAVAHLQKTLGNYRFSKVIVQRDESKGDESKEDAVYKNGEPQKKAAPKNDAAPADATATDASATNAPASDASASSAPSSDTAATDAPLYVYEYVNPDKPSEPIWVAWAPSGSQHESLQKIPVTGQVVKAERMPLKPGDADSVDFKTDSDGIEIKIAESPTYLFLKQ